MGRTSVQKSLDMMYDIFYIMFAFLVIS